MRRLLPALALIGATAALGGCNETTGSLAVPIPASGPAAPPVVNFNLPPGRPCSAEIERYQDVIGRDVTTGYLNRSVYNQIETELTRAAAACSGGQDGQSMALVQASQAKHGYHT